MKPYQNPIIPNSPTATTWDPYVLRYGKQQITIAAEG